MDQTLQENNWTKEPLTSEGRWIYDNEHSLIGETIIRDTRENQNMAARLVLCYNAMQGLTSDQVSSLRGIVGELANLLTKAQGNIEAKWLYDEVTAALLKSEQYK